VSAQVADEWLAPDVLGTVKEMKAVNFRRVPKMPVYGMAQPTSEVQHIHSEAFLHHLEGFKRVEGILRASIFTLSM